MGADLDEGNFLGAAVNAALAAADMRSGGIASGGLKFKGPFTWGSKPWEQAGMRKWMGETGFLQKGQSGHHWLLEQASKAPNWLKNQPPFINPMKGAIEHGRIHGPYTANGVRLPQYNAAQRFWYGTPDWFKAMNVSIPGHAGMFAGRAGSNRK